MSSTYHTTPAAGSSTLSAFHNSLSLLEKRYSRPKSWHSTTSSLRFADIDPDSQSLDIDHEDDDEEIRDMMSSTTITNSIFLSVNQLDPDSFVKHPDLWFSDGSIVLAASGILFRVHISLLSRHSAFFRDMFTLPQPPTSTVHLHQPQTSQPKLKSLRSRRDLRNSSIVHIQRSNSDSGVGLTEVEGCPVVYLHDTAEDLASLLYALYDGPKFGSNDKADFRVTAGILRLATKYLIDLLRTKALDHLSIAWPSTLKGWDAREDLAGEYYVDVEGRRFYPSPVEVINLAREIDAPQLLPPAFYDLSRYHLNHIFEPSKDELNIHGLSLADTQKLVLGREAAHYTVSALIRAMACEAGSPSSGHPSMANGVNVNGNNNYGIGPIGIGAPRGNNNNAFGILGPHATALRDGRTGHRRISSTGCTTSAACRRDVSELASLATQHYLLDRERGSRDPLYVAEELGLLKSAEMNLYSDTNVEGGAGAMLNEGAGESGECKACGRMLEMWARKERERIWRLIPGWFRLDV